jgi:hypothetical protein
MNKGPEQMVERWIAEPGAARGAWIKNAQTGEWTALACGDTDESAARHARMIAATPSTLAALHACIDAYKTGRNEPMVAAIEAAENLLSDISQ